MKHPPTQPRAGKALTPARDAAIHRLARQVRLDPNLDLGAMDDAALDPRDAALAHAIVEESIRRWRTIEHLIQRGLSRPFAELQPEVRAALLAGGAQVLFFDGVPVHAAIDESVEWAKQRVRAGAAGLVNAALRRLAELAGERERRAEWTMRPDEVPLSGGGSLALREGSLPDGRAERVAIATGLPTGLVERWAIAFSEDAAARLAAHTIAHPPTIVQVGHAERPLPEDCLAPHDDPDSRVFTGSRDRLLTLLRERSDVWVQDPASGAVVQAARRVVEAPGLIMDVCAGRGTKTRQLAAAYPGAAIVATDVDARRRATLSGLFSGHPRVHVVEPGRLIDHAGQAAMVLIDAPCSNTGVLARRVEARRRADDRAVESLAGVQRQILADSIRLLGPQGRIVYATCSLDDRENGDHVRWASRWHGLRPQLEETILPSGGPGQSASRWRDGSYVVVLGGR